MASSAERESDSILRGILYLCISMAFFPFLNASVKYLGAHYPMAEIIWARYVGHLIYMVVLFAPKRGFVLFKTGRPGLQIIRSLMLLGSTSFYFLALRTLPLGTAVAITFVGPIMVTALSVPFLGEKVGPRRWAAVAVGLVGALIIIRPGGQVAQGASLYVIASAACYSAYQLLSRKISARDSAETSVTYLALVGVVATSFIVPFDFRLPDIGWHWALFAGLGLFGGLAHYFVVKAYGMAPASVLSPLGYGQLIGDTIMGLIVFGNFPDGWTWVGAAVIVASGLYIGYRERKVRPAA